MERAHKRYPFYIGITTLVVVIVVVLTGLFLWISHRESRNAAVKMADRLFTEINQKTLERYENALESVAVLAGTAVRMPGIDRPPTGDGHSYAGLELMLEALDFYKYLFSLYTGYDDGSFVQVIAARDDIDIQAVYGAPPKTYFILRSITTDSQGTRHEQRQFFDYGRRVIGSRGEPDPTYDPRVRPWYIRAKEEKTAFYTEPYVFSATQLPGITCAEKFISGGGAFGGDITLERFSVSLQRQQVSENGLLFLFDYKGRIIAHPHENPILKAITKNDGQNVTSLRFLYGEQSNDPLVRAIVSAHLTGRESLLNQTREMLIDGQPYLVRLSGIKPELKFDQILASVAPVSDFTGHIKRMQQRVYFFSILVMLVVLPLVLWVSRRISGSLVRLEKESIKIQQFDFSESEPFDSTIKEIHSLIQAYVLMKTTIRDRTDALIATQKKLQTLVQSGIALTAENDMDRLLRKIFDNARDLARADGGALFLRDDVDNLCFEIMQNAQGETVRADAVDGTADFAPIPIQESPGEGATSLRVESHVALTGKTVVVNQMDAESEYDFSNTCRLDETAGLACINLLTAPLRTREGKTIGVLQMFNARDDKTEDITPFNEEIVGFVEALAAQAAVALHNKRLLEEQRVLFDAFLQLIAGAIDAKSPYTGGHCARVPELAFMLARAAHDAQNGPFADFKMEEEDQWREFNVAAWLHDCGKVTTPEYVVDKATKLETIYNRIHEIRTRFEVLLRDAEIDFLRQRLEGGRDVSDLKAELEARHRQLCDDFAFVAECNVGGEFMADEKIERLQQIASHTWLRNLDDRIGLSEEEAGRKARQPQQPLPVMEHVLADKGEHIIPRTNPDPYDGNPFGFNMPVPEDLYNLGEVYNLSIRKGTLSAEDRFKINEHIIQTIKMLKKLPFPDYLENVAEFAGAHHETMIGTGYPRGLKKEDMSTPARIMAIADIFEALTAADRPYKKAKKLSEALRIMSFMRNDQHIDAELFDLFLKSGVHQTYAQRFLDPAQIDAVNIQQYLSTPNADQV